MIEDIKQFVNRLRSGEIRMRLVNHSRALNIDRSIEVYLEEQKGATYCIIVCIIVAHYLSITTQSALYT